MAEPHDSCQILLPSARFQTLNHEDLDSFVVAVGNDHRHFEENIWRWRLQTSFPVCKIRSLTVMQRFDDTVFKISRDARLIPISKISMVYSQRRLLHLLKECVIGLERLTKKFNSFRLTPDMVLIDQSGNCRVWHHSNLRKNSPEFPTPETSSPTLADICGVFLNSPITGPWRKSIEDLSKLCLDLLAAIPAIEELKTNPILTRTFSETSLPLTISNLTENKYPQFLRLHRKLTPEPTSQPILNHEDTTQEQKAHPALEEYPVKTSNSEWATQQTSLASISLSTPNSLVKKIVSLSSVQNREQEQKFLQLPSESMKTSHAEREACSASLYQETSSPTSNASAQEGGMASTSPMSLQSILSERGWQNIEQLLCEERNVLESFRLGQDVMTPVEFPQLDVITRRVTVSLVPEDEYLLER